jgi:hypothetical protein
MKKTIILVIVGLLIFNSFLVVGWSIKNDIEVETIPSDDFDPLVDINLTVDILEIRAFEKINNEFNPGFFVKILINEEEFVSPVYDNSWYLYDCFSVTKDVPDNIQIVDITIQLWNWNSGNPQICDISENENIKDEGYGINLVYDLSNGRWTGDDYYIGDGSGYGRANGVGDGSIYINERDCELFFNIYQNDYDSDGLAYWLETNVYGTDPEINNKGDDADFDGIPIEWEHRFGFNPFIWDDHENFDPDDDSLNNTEEFLTSVYGSDPYRRDIFLELDFMDGGPDNINNSVSNRAYELVKRPFNRRDIVFHIDSGQIYGGDIIPFDDYVTNDESVNITEEFYMKDESEAWRRGVFHYGIICYFSKPAGYAFRGDMYPSMGYGPGTNCFIFGSNLIRVFEEEKIFYTTDREFLYASNIMHEIGHNFGFRFGSPFGVDNFGGSNPWRINFWLFANYKSCMNYRYVYKILDYSDGSHGKRDHDDWEHIDLSYFEIPEYNNYQKLGI